MLNEHFWTTNFANMSIFLGGGTLKVRKISGTHSVPPLINMPKDEESPCLTFLTKSADSGYPKNGFHEPILPLLIT